ncbi:MULTISPECIES: helix-turn-helix domain-containing protein [Streptomyces]|uniref:helix-turn-helix domain-containing protein n=1 Tax=Streptomyces TaxID=1883 RepID=UPI000DC65ADE|nr:MULTISPECIES: helix-turn-helix transcriptional regulator [Streptomyces]NUW20983.1 helix-turn-helix domain-containing protein [Streptomyces roseoviolaceus]ATY98052.1 transcriptional regulator [Streptomyces cavourensis]MBH0245204.1 helix-turn-helix transcriptional regulator [Streptomyces cavourensis]NUV44895.1 helix-turn-helix domain-containing protein [Streptomyces sp. CAI-24]NUV84536.1 helix-turn-helix domain-containing protein [Streptomyces sp. CAI-155]
MVNRKQLDPENPDISFGFQLRQARDARGWTQDELAGRMGCSGTHVSAVETGRRSPTPRFARSADRALGTGEKFSRMVQAMKDLTMLEGFPEYVVHEGRAVEIRLYEVGIIPGLLQTPEYARVLADSAVRRGAITPEQADERVAFLAKRQAALVRPQPPMLFVTMDESCIRRPVGGSAVMNAQLDRLMEFAEMPNTVLQVAPYEIGEERTFDLPVYLLTLADRSVVAYAESQTQGRLDRESSFVLPMLTAYHQLQGASLSQTASVAKISQLRKGTL